MKVFRLIKDQFKNDLSGKGAELYGGRWNNKGVPMIYTSASRALCTAEIAVHIPLGIVPSDYWLMIINVPDSIPVFEVDLRKLPEGWRSFPYDPSTQIIGDEFISSGLHLIMKAPSAVVQDEFNYLINPAHKSFSKTKIAGVQRFEFDERLFRRD